MRISIFSPFAVLLTLACVSPRTTVTLLNQKYQPSKSKDCDILVLTQAPTDRKYEELAILNTVATDDMHGKDLNAMLPSIKEAACNLGADAVIIKNVEPGSIGSNKSTGKAYTVAIKFIN